MFKNIFSSKSIFTLSLFAVPVLITQKPYKCAFWTKKKPNNIEERLFLHQINSNKPCEDRYDYRQLKNINAYAAAVYDGHGGWQVVIDSMILVRTVQKSIANVCGFGAKPLLYL